MKLGGLSYQAEPISWIIPPDVILNIPVRHHFRYHRASAGLRIDVDSDELQEVGMSNGHPDDGLLAEALNRTPRLLTRPKDMVGCVAHLLSIDIPVSQCLDSHCFAP